MQLTKYKLILGLSLVAMAVFVYSCAYKRMSETRRESPASAQPSKEPRQAEGVAQESEPAAMSPPYPYGPPSMGPPPVAHANRTGSLTSLSLDHLKWNVWAEAESHTPGFSPVAFLRPDDKPYQLILDLAALAYRDNPDIFVRAAGGQLRASLQKLVDSDAPDTDLTLVIIPDERFFKTTSLTETLRINLDGLRKALKVGLNIPKTPLATLRQNPEADFSFGRQPIRFRTLKREGLGSIAIALWADGVPVDELSIPLCVASDPAAAARNCKSVNKLHDSLAGIDPVRVAAQQDASAMKPDAALHFIELNPSTQVGIFRDNSWPEGKYESWKLSKSATATQTELQQILARFDIATNDSHLLQVGKELYNLLFPDDEKTKYQAFDNFIAHPRELTDPADPPSIFVRLLTRNNEEPPFLIPLGIMAHEINGKKDFVGFHFRIQTPLQVQDYEPYPKCISNWVVLAPPANASGVPPELNAARERFSAWFENWEFKPIPEMDEFIDWADASVTETEPISIFILAHHAGNSLYFEENPRLGPNGIRRRFKMPSVAFVNGCETGAPGTSAIVQRLNNRGVSAVIATAGKVDRLLAGDFFSVLGHYLTTMPAGKEYSLGAAHFLTLKDLRDRKPDENSFPYGAKVLAYEVMGNSSLRICSPPLKGKP